MIKSHSEQAVTEELVSLAAEHVRPSADFRSRVLVAASKAESRRTRLRSAIAACMFLIGTSIVTAGLSLPAGVSAQTAGDSRDGLIPGGLARANEHREALAFAHVSGEWNTVEAAQQIRRSQSETLQRMFLGQRAVSSR